MERSQCDSCAFMQMVKGRLGQRYVLCRNDAIDAKYPRQPVLACPGYEKSTAKGDEAADGE